MSEFNQPIRWEEVDNFVKDTNPFENYMRIKNLIKPNYTLLNFNEGIRGKKENSNEVETPENTPQNPNNKNYNKPIYPSQPYLKNYSRSISG